MHELGLPVWVSQFVLVYIAPFFGSTPDTGGAGGGLIRSRERDEYLKIKDYLG
jgi:hypothetical protein